MPPKKKEKTPADIAAEKKKKEIAKKEFAKKRAKAAAHREEVKEDIGDQFRLLPTKPSLNEDKIRSFFEKLKTKNLEDSKLKDRIYKFYNDNFNTLIKSEKDIFQELLKTFPPELYKELLKQYVEQSKPFNIFWASYKDRADIREKRFEYSKKVKEEEEEVVEGSSYKPIELPQPPKIYDPLLEKKVGEIDSEDDVLPQKFKQIKQKGVSEFPYKLVIEPFDDYSKINKDTLWPWISNVTEIYVTKANENSDIASLSHDKGFIIKDGVKWHKINDRFTNIISRSRRYWNDRDSTVEIVKLRDNKSLFVKFAYKVEGNDDLIMQTRRDFQNEKSYIQEFNIDKNGKIRRLMLKEIDAGIQNFGKRKLSELLTIKTEDVNTQPNPEYISKIIQKMVEITENIGEFLGKLANLLVFLRNKKSVFFERVKEEYYIPEILCTLSTEEKLPEIFEDPESEKTDIERRIKVQILAENNALKDSLYNFLHPTERTDTLPQKLIPLDTETASKGWKSVCLNKKDVEGVQNASIVYYTEDKKVYCLNIWDIYDQIKEGKTPRNISTGKKLDKEFVKRIQALYDPNKFTHSTILEEEERLEPVKEKIPAVKEKIYAPGLLEMIIKNITECEQEIEGDSGVKKCKSFADDEEYIKPEDESGSEDEKSSEDESEPEKKKSSDTSEDEDEDESEPEKKKSSDTSENEDEDETDLKKKKSSDTSDLESEDELNFPEARFGATDHDPKLDSSYKSVKSDSDSSYKSAVSDVDSDANSNSPVSSKLIIKKGNICQYCGKKFKVKDITQRRVHKTTIQTEENKFQDLYFCKFPAKCFENYDFPDSIFKKHKKGGRCSSADRKKK